MQASYQNQHLNTTATRVFSQATADFFIKRLSAGVAVALHSKDFARGTYKEVALNVTYAQYLRLMDGNLSIIPSLQLHMEHSALDLNALHYGDHITWFTVWTNPAMVPSARNRSLSYNGGLLLNYKDRFYAGISGFHLNEPAAGFLPGYKYPMLLKYHASYNQKLGEKHLAQLVYRHHRQYTMWANQLSANFLFSNRMMGGAGISFYENNSYRNKSKHTLLLLNIGVRFQNWAFNLSGDIDDRAVNAYFLGSVSAHVSININKTRVDAALATFEGF